MSSNAELRNGAERPTEDPEEADAQEAAGTPAMGQENEKQDMLALSAKEGKTQLMSNNAKLNNTERLPTDAQEAAGAAATGQQGEEENENQNMLDLIASKRKTQFAHLLLYNSIKKDGTADHAIEKLSEIHENVMLLHGFMAGFQFVVLDSGESCKDEGVTCSNLDHAILGLRFIGFVSSLMGTLMSLIAQEYFKSVEGERLEFQVVGILNHQPFFRTSELLEVLSATLLITTATMGLYGNLPDEASWTLSVIVAFLLVWGLRKFYIIILARQHYGMRHLYDAYEAVDGPVEHPQ